MSYRTHTPQNPRPALAKFQQLEPLEQRAMLAASYNLGINVNDASSAVMHKAIPVLKSLGVKSVRIWSGVKDFNSRRIEGPMERAIDYANAGFDVMLIVNPNNGKVPSASAVKGWFNWAAGNSSLKNAVDRWQVGNEVDRDHYWKGSFSSYVSTFLKPAYEALKSKGETVVSGSVSWNPADIKALVNAGMLNYTDYVGYHPYSNGVNSQKSVIGQVQSIIGGRKPLAATEWNIRGYEGNKRAWSAAVEDAMPNVRKGFAINYYFGLLNTGATKAGPGGVMNKDGSKTPFYYAIQKGLGGSASLPDAPAKGSPDNGGAVPSSRPSVSKLNIYTGGSRKLLIDSVKDGATIDARAAGGNSFYIAAAAGSGVGSIKFVIDGKTTVENASPYGVTKTLADGTHTISVTAYSRDNAGGTKGTTRTFKVTVKRGATVSTTPSTSGKPAVSSFSLFNADTDKAIAGFADLNNGDVIDLARLKVKNVNIVANTGGPTSSVKFKFNSVFSTDNSPKYTLYGENSGSDLKGNPLAVGKYTITATPFSRDNATGAMGASKIVSFAIKSGSSTGSTPSSSTSPKVTALRLINLRSGKAIAGYENITGYRSIKLSSLPTRNIAVAAVTSGTVSSVKFGGALTAYVDNTPTYWKTWSAKTGTYTFKATAYSSDHARGTAGNTLSLTLKFY